MTTPLIIAHRAQTDGGPEQTLGAIGAAAAAGVDIVELDIRLTLDRRPIVIHDPLLGRTTDRHGPVALWPSPLLRRAHIGDEAVPMLKDVLRTQPEGIALGLHVKALGVLGPTLCNIRRYGDPANTWLWLASMNAVLRAQERFPGIRCVLLRPGGWVETRRETYFRDAQVCGATAVSIASGAIAPDLIRHAHRHRLLVFSRIDRLDQVAPLARAGVDGLITAQSAAAVAQRDGIAPGL